MKVHGRHIVRQGATGFAPVEYDIDVEVLDVSTHTEEKRIVGSAVYTIEVREWSQFAAMLQAAGVTLTGSALRAEIEEKLRELGSTMLGEMR